MQFKAYSPLVEVNGETVYAIVDGMIDSKDKALQILRKHGIQNPQPGKWFNQQDWLDSFKEIADELGDNALFNIGQRIPLNAIFPTEINTLMKALAAIDYAYHLNHRYGEIGSYKFQMLNDRTVKIFCNNPYPCAFDLGIIKAMVLRFMPDNNVLVKHDEMSPCRKNGAESCTYFISW
jgi:hypothetical protein